MAQVHGALGRSLARPYFDAINITVFCFVFLLFRRPPPCTPRASSARSPPCVLSSQQILKVFSWARTFSDFILWCTCVKLILHPSYDSETDPRKEEKNLGSRNFSEEHVQQNYGRHSG
eukprot:scaffold25278_cov132-Cylindrotheca_fusiformis.AAC.6